MADPRIEIFNTEAEKVLQYLHGEFAKLQTGRASAALVENIDVEAYGQRQPLKALAGISIQDARSIVIQPWDKSILQHIERALLSADLGTAPVNNGMTLRINLPPMTEERRERMTKMVHGLAEESRISLRQQRDRLREEIKQEKDEDVRYTTLEALDKAAESAKIRVEDSAKKKEEEVMTV